jgi:hypothetical protein
MSAKGSGGATDEEHGGAEMFGRRKLQLLLDVSRVADIKVCMQNTHIISPRF